MTRVYIEAFREIVLSFVEKKLLEINYENLGESDAKEFAKDFNEIINLAIRALEQETCEDCISRDAVVERLKKEDKILYTTTGLCYLIRVIEELPSVTQKSETVTEFADRCRECGAKYGKILEQAQGGDLISRQAVLDIAKSSKSNWIDNSVLFKRVNELPPIKPQPCGDVISRQVVKDKYRERLINNLKDDDRGIDLSEYAEEPYKVFCEFMDSIPPVNPQKFCDTCKHSDETDGSHCYECVKSMKDNYDSQEPKMGQWLRHDTGHSVYYDCSLCGCAAPCTETADKILWKMANYCPDCGKRMENNGERWVEIKG